MSNTIRTKNSKRKLFEETFENRLDFTPGDLLETTYKDPVTEERWVTWSTCWDAINGRFTRLNKNINALLENTK